MPRDAVPDLHWIEPGFAIGGRPIQGQRVAIRALGVDTVIALHAPQPDEAPAWATLGVEFIAFPTPDWVRIPPERLSAVVEAVLEQRRAGRGVLLHCLAGANRAPTFASAVLCRRDGFSVEAAITRIRTIRPFAAPTYEQVASLRSWFLRTCQPPRTTSALAERVRREGLDGGRGQDPRLKEGESDELSD